MRTVGGAVTSDAASIAAARQPARRRTQVIIFSMSNEPEETNVGTMQAENRGDGATRCQAEETGHI
jgi:hypothetical protein